MRKSRGAEHRALAFRPATLDRMRAAGGPSLAPSDARIAVLRNRITGQREMVALSDDQLAQVIRRVRAQPHVCPELMSSSKISHLQADRKSVV